MAARETDTVFTTLFDVGWPEAPHRVLRNSTVKRWLEAGSPPPGRRPEEGAPVARTPSGETLPRYHFAAPVRGLSGDLEAMALYAGQSAGLISELKPAGEIVREIVEEAVSALGRVSHLVAG